MANSNYLYLKNSLASDQQPKSNAESHFSVPPWSTSSASSSCMSLLQICIQ